MKIKNFFLLFICFFLNDCNPTNFENPCSPSSETFKKNFSLKIIAGDKTAYCGINTNTNSRTATGSTSNGTDVSPTVPVKQAKFLLVLNNTANTITIYSINPTTGVLTQIGSPFASGTLVSPRFISMHPSGLYVYVANGTGASVAGFAINSTTGALTSIGAAFTAPTNTYALVLNSAGTFLYAASYTGREVYLYSINQTNGVLTYIQSFNTTPVSGHTGALFIDSTGNFMYTGNTFSPGLIDAFAINQTTGYLTLLGAPGPYSFGNNAIAVTVDPFSKFVYGGYYSSTHISAFTMNTTTGALTQIAGSPFAKGGTANATTFLTVEATGKFLYVANSGSANISGFVINSSTGFLTEIAGSPFTGSASPSVIYTDPTSSFLYCANTAGSGTVSGFTINQTTGALTQISGSPWLTNGSNPFGLAFVSY